MHKFQPAPMRAAHWHGHVEFNLISGGSMHYDYDGRKLEIPNERPVTFWAGIPHQLTRIEPVSDNPVILTNLYVPVDAFLLMPHISRLQIALLAGAVVALSDNLLEKLKFNQWFEDFGRDDMERREVIKMEINATLRRALLDELTFLSQPSHQVGKTRSPSSAHAPKLVQMVRHILENLHQPLKISDVARVVDLHPNYASSLFAETLRVPMKRFIIRMRLLRARALLMESSAAITTVAENAGFSSITQFYEHFKSAYGVSPFQMRNRYAQIE